LLKQARFESVSNSQYWAPVKSVLKPARIDHWLDKNIRLKMSNTLS
jgi:hypothetical protein